MNKTQTITEFFELDHREIDAIFDGVKYDGAKGDAERFAEFASRLERHIRWEEELLFPAAAKAAPELQHGPIRVMLAEHVEIRALLKSALAAFKKGAPGEAKTAAAGARAILEEHNRKEEMVLYPLCDRMIPDASGLVASLPGR